MKILKRKNCYCWKCHKTKEETYLFINAKELGIRTEVEICLDCIKKKYPKAKEYIEKYKEIKARKEKLKKELEKKKELLKAIENFDKKTIALELGICRNEFCDSYPYEITLLDLAKELRFELSREEIKKFCEVLLYESKAQELL